MKTQSSYNVFLQLQKKQVSKTKERIAKLCMSVCMQCVRAPQGQVLSRLLALPLSLSLCRSHTYVHMHVGNCKWLEHVGFVVAFIPNYNKLPVLAQSPFLEF